jgi:ELWxxDGT repeat protein
METNITNAPLSPIVVITGQVVKNPSQLTNVEGTVYFQGNSGGLYKLDASGQPLLLGDPTTYGSLGLSMITNTKGIVYFVGYDGSKQGLYRVDPSTGAPVRLGDMLIITSNAGPSGNIVNIGGSDYFLANRGNDQLWEIDRVSGALAQVAPTGLPASFSFDIDEPNTGNNFRAANNNLAVGGNLYFRGNGQVWKFDPITNNATPIEIPGQATYSPGELHQLGDTLFFKTNSRSAGQELYKIDPISGSAVLVSDPKFASDKYVIDDNNFIDVNGTLHFVANYGNEVWKLDSTGKAVLAGTVSGAGRSNEATEFTNVNGKIYFKFDDGVNKAQIWKIQSDGTAAVVTTIAPNPNYGTTLVGGLKGIGNKLYFSANDAQYGRELRELDGTTDSLTTLDLSPGLYASSPADSFLNSKIIDVNGTPYFSGSVKPEGVSYSEDRIYKLAPAGTVVPDPVIPTTPVVTPTPTTPITPTNPVDTTPAPTAIEPPITVTAVDKNAAETTTGEIANGGQFVLTRKGDVSAAQDAFYLLSGTATNGIDYQKLTGKATFEAGKTTTIVDIKNIVDDNIYEGNETILLSIVPEDQASGGAFKIASNLSNTAILNKLLGDTTGLSNINLSVTGNKEAYGTFDNAPFDIGAGIVLSTGKVTELVGANKDGSTTTSFNTSDLDGGFDPIALKIDFNTDSTANQVFFQYVFGSEEFVEFSGSPFNDLFTLTLNGVNLAKLSDGKTASINNLTPSTDAKTWSSDYINNPSETGPLSSQVILDGYTKTLTFAGNLIPNAKNTLEIKIKDVNDSIYDSAVFLKGGSLGVVDPTTLANTITIADNDLPPVVSITDVSFNEGKNDTSTGTFTVELSNPSSLVTTVDYGTTDDTAVAGTDYTKVEKATLSFAPGETSKKIVIPLIGDLVDEVDKAFKLNLSNPTGNATLGNQTATGTISNDDTPISIAVIDNTAVETKPGETANPGQFVITRNGDSNKTLTVKYKLSGTGTNGEDYETLTGTSIFAVGVDKVFVDIEPIDDAVYQETESITLSVSDEDYIITGSNSITATIADNDPSEPTLIEPGKNILSILGGSAQTLMKFSKMSQQGNDRSEVFAFVVDDDLGRINGIKPGESGYLAAAIDRAESIFSSLGNSDFDKRNDRNSERYLNITPGKKVEFLEIIDNTLDAVKSDLLAGKSISSVVFSIAEANIGNANLVKFTAIPTDIPGEDSYEIGFKDLVLKVETLDKVGIPIGTALQGKSEGQLIDLRAQDSIIFDTKTIGDAGYKNYIALYEVEDEKGTLANGLKPGDEGYAEAAINSAVLKTRFTSQADTSLSLAGGKILAPVVVANGTFEDFLSRNPTNKADGDIHVYFNFIGANTDKVDHFRLLGDNKFGVEDVYGGGDRDFNDLVFHMNIKG